jgi:hypothetical protein
MNVGLKYKVAMRGTLVYRDADGEVLAEVPFWTADNAPITQLHEAAEAKAPEVQYERAVRSTG